jgi:hypothetical protein
VGSRGRTLPGVAHFDVARSLTDPNTLIADEVFEDREALERQNVQGKVTLIGAGVRRRPSSASCTPLAVDTSGATGRGLGVRHASDAVSSW